MCSLCCVECDKWERLTDFAGSQTSLHFSNCPAKHIIAAFFDDVRTLLAPIEFNQLAGWVHDEGSKVMLDLWLFRGLVTLALGCSLTMHVLELSEVLKRCGTLCWRLLTDLVQVVGENAAFSKSDFIIPLAQVVEDWVNTCDDATGVVKNASLLHVEIVRDVHIALLAIFRLFQELSIGNHSCDRLR